MAKKKRRTAQDFKDDLKTLRRYYTGFDKAHGFDERRLSPGAKRVIQRFTPQIKQLKALKYYPHKELPVSGRAKDALVAAAPVPAEALRYKAKRVEGSGRRRKVQTVTVEPRPRLVPVFTVDERAKVSQAKDKALRVTEYGHIRDVYKIDRKAFSIDPYGYMREFMKRHKAQRVTLNVGGNVIGEVFSEWDFVDEEERRRRLAAGDTRVRPAVGLFVTIVEKYKEKDPVRAQHFIEAIGAVSVLRGGVGASNDFRREVNEGRNALREERQLAELKRRKKGRRKVGHKGGRRR